MKYFSKLLIIILIIWLSLFLVTKYLLNSSKANQIDTYGFQYDVFEIYNIIAVTSIGGSGEFVYIDYHWRSNQSILKSLYANQDKSSLEKVSELSILNDSEQDLFDEGTFFIADVDFDKSFEVVRYSPYYPRIAKDIYEVSPENRITREKNIISLFVISLICFFNNYLSFFVTFVLLLSTLLFFVIKVIRQIIYKVF